MTRSPEHPLVAVYLQRFDEASGGIPEPRRSELRAELAAHLHEACIGSISEIFDAEEPFTPRGCIAQAWSVAEVLRILVKIRNLTR